MNNSISTDSREQGFVLVLALFMLTICTIIGMAAMSTSTTELDIAGNERVHKETFYQAEAGSSAAAEALLDKEAYDTWSSGTDKFADLGLNGYIQINDWEFLLEAKDVNPWPGSTWEKDDQVEDTIEAWVPGESPDISIRTNQFHGDVDVDKVDVRHLAGSGAEFGSGAEGSGVSSHKVIYNMDCIGTLPSRHLRLADNTIDQYVPKSEVFLGYRYVPR
jgi:hypothetical protein